LNETPAAAETPAPVVRKPRGLAAVSPERRREISRMGGKAAEAAGVRHRFNPETARAAGQKAAAKLHAEGKAYQWTPETAREASLKAAGVPRGVRKGSAPAQAPDEGAGSPAMD
jgi:general stress protein YciG